MNLFTRRLATVALAGALAVGSLTGCGIFGSGLDCAKLYDASNQIMEAGSDPEKMKSALDELQKAAEDVDDQELKDAVNDLVTETKKSVAILENPESAATAEQADSAKVKAASDTITEKCS